MLSEIGQMIQTWARHNGMAGSEMSIGILQRSVKASKFRPLSVIFLAQANMPTSSILPSALKFKIFKSLDLKS